jgi:hypothetical protein
MPEKKSTVLVKELKILLQETVFEEGLEGDLTGAKLRGWRKKISECSAGICHNLQNRRRWAGPGGAPGGKTSSRRGS